MCCSCIVSFLICVCVACVACVILLSFCFGGAASLVHIVVLCLTKTKKHESKQTGNGNNTKQKANTDLTHLLLHFVLYLGVLHVMLCVRLLITNSGTKTEAQGNTPKLEALMENLKQMTTNPNNTQPKQ